MELKKAIMNTNEENKKKSFVFSSYNLIAPEEVFGLF